jgi:hypothetical protein
MTYSFFHGEESGQTSFCNNLSMISSLPDTETLIRACTQWHSLSYRLELGSMGSDSR